MSAGSGAVNVTRTANDKQVGGDHYKKHAIQPWDFITDNNIPFLDGNAITYIARWRDKNGLDDLYKAQHYLEKIIENEKKRLEAELVKELTAPDPVPTLIHDTSRIPNVFRSPAEAQSMRDAAVLAKQARYTMDKVAHDTIMERIKPQSYSDMRPWYTRLWRRMFYV